MVNTVRGPLEAQELGNTLMHEHVVLVDNSMKRCFPEWFNEQIFSDKIGPVLKVCKEKGIQTLVDLSNINMGRDIRLLKRISEENDINIIASTGLYYTEEAWQANKPVRELADLFIRDIEEGCEGTDIKAGIIKCGTGDFGVTAINKIQLLAAGICSYSTGAPIYTHSVARLKNGLEQVEIFEKNGVDMSKVVIGHIGDTNDLEYVEELLKRGVYVGLDRFGSEFLWPEKDRIRNLIELLSRGWADRLIISHDYPYFMDWGRDNFNDFRERGSFDHYVLYTHIHNNVLPVLRENGISETDIYTMLVDNPARILSF